MSIKLNWPRNRWSLSIYTSFCIALSLQKKKRISEAIWVTVWPHSLLFRSKVSMPQTDPRMSLLSKRALADTLYALHLSECWILHLTHIYDSVYSCNLFAIRIQNEIVVQVIGAEGSPDVLRWRVVAFGYWPIVCYRLPRSNRLWLHHIGLPCITLHYTAIQCLQAVFIQIPVSHCSFGLWSFDLLIVYDHRHSLKEAPCNTLQAVSQEADSKSR